MMLKLRTVFCVALLCGTALLNCSIAQNVTDAGKPFLAKTNADFNFPGGSVDGLIEAIRIQYAVDLNELATIPPQMLSLLVPKMRVHTGDFKVILNVYNSVSQDSGGNLGKWMITRISAENPNIGEIAAIQLVPAPNQKEDEFAVQAFPLSISSDEFEVLESIILLECDVIEQQRANTGWRSPGTGRFLLHRKTGIVVASGSRDYVNLVSTIVRAYKEKQTEKDLEQPERRSLKPIPSEKSKQ